MKKVLAAVVLLLTTHSSSFARQDHALCSTTPVGPFTVTSGAPFTVLWLMPDTVQENGFNLPNRYDGFYIEIDGGPKTDIKPTAFAACSASTQKPGDIPYSYVTPSGVSRGPHNLRISAWNYLLDGAGNPTTTKQESAIHQIPFTAGDPTLLGAPGPPYNGAIVGKQGEIPTGVKK